MNKTSFTHTLRFQIVPHQTISQEDIDWLFVLLTASVTDPHGQSHLNVPAVMSTSPRCFSSRSAHCPGAQKVITKLTFGVICRLAVMAWMVSLHASITSRMCWGFGVHNPQACNIDNGTTLIFTNIEWALQSFSQKKTTLFQREPFLTIFYIINSYPLLV